MSTIDFIIIGALIVYSLSSGVLNRKKASAGLEEFFLAGRNLSGWKAGISMAATQFAADTPLLVTGLIATGGIFALWRLWIYAIAFLLLGFLLGASWRKSGVLTDAELTELRYGSSEAGLLRGVKAIYFGTIFNCTVLAMVLLASTRIAEPFLLWNAWLPDYIFLPLQSLVETVGVPFSGNMESSTLWLRSTNNVISIGVILLVTTLYSTSGGLRSVVATDVLQFSMAMLGTGVFCWLVVSKLGGLDALASGLKEKFNGVGPGRMSASQLLGFTPWESSNTSSWVMIMLGLQWLVQINADGSGYLAQRLMACKSDQDAKKAAFTFTFAQVVFRSLLWLPICLGLLLLYPFDVSTSGSDFVANREFTFVRAIGDILPPGVLGLMLASMFAALASTLDTHLNWGASYWTNDIYKRFICKHWLKKQPTARNLLWVARLANLGTLLIALAIVPFLSSVQKAWQVSLLIGAGMGTTLVLRWVWWRITAPGELAAIIVSTFLAPILLYTVPDDREALRLLFMALVSTSATVVVSIFYKKEPLTQLVQFYKKTKPPGFWGPIALAAGDSAHASQRHLMKATVEVASASLSLFCLLVGIGSYLVGSDGPEWISSRSTWVTLNLLTSVILAPIWVRSLFFESPTKKS